MDHGPVFATTSSAQCGPPSHPGGTVIDQVTTPPAWGIAVRDDGLTLFTEPYNDGVGVTSTKTRTLDGFIVTGSIPTGISFSPDGQRAYVANQFNNNVGVIDATTSQQIATFSTEDASPFVTSVSPDGSQLFIATNIGRIYIVDAASLAVIARVEVGSAVNGFVAHPDGRIMYVSSFTGGTVYELDILTSTLLRTFFVGGTPQDMAITRNGRRLYVANEAGYLNEIDLQTGQLASPIQLAGGGFGVGVTPDDAQAYVSIPSQGLVQVFSLQTRRLSGTINVGGDPRRIGFSQQGHIGAVANMGGYVTLVR